jgi:hypothetical protein
MGEFSKALDRINDPDGTNLGHWSRGAESSDNRTYAEWKADSLREERKRELAVAQREATKALSDGELCRTRGRSCGTCIAQRAR